MFNEYRVSVCKIKKFLEVDDSDGYTTMSMPLNLMPLNCTLKMVKIVNFMLYVFYHNF